jgi:hypothetical protein
MSRFKIASRLYHASPYDFNQLRDPLDYVGKGQGASTYGAGLYVAESPEISGPGRSHYMLEFDLHPAVIARSGEPQEFFLNKKVSPNAGALNAYSDNDIEYLRKIVNSEADRVSKTRDNHPIFDHQVNLKNMSNAEVISGLRRLFSKYRSVFNSGWYGDNLNFHDFLHLYPTSVEKRALSKPVDKKERSDAEFAKMLAGVSSILPGETFQYRRLDGGPLSYEMSFGLGPHEVLLWDHPLDVHHPDARTALEQLYDDEVGLPRIQSRIDRRGIGERYFVDMAEYTSGEELYKELANRLGGREKASRLLRSYGIRAIKYRDQKSRWLDNELLLDLDTNSEEFPKPTSDEDEAFFVLKNMVRSREFYTLDEINSYIEDFIKRKLASPVFEITLKNAQKFLKKYKDRLSIRVPERTHNYVLLDEKAARLLAKYDIKGNKVEDFGGEAVVLKPVDHDPFK